MSVPTRAAVVGTLTGAEMRRLARDRIGLFFIVVLPAVIIIVIGTTIGGGPQKLPVGVVDSDNSAVSRKLLDGLAEDAGLTLTRYTDRADLEADIRTQNQIAGVVIPAGFGAAAQTNPPARLIVVSAPASGNGQAVEPLVQTVVDKQGSALAAAAFVASREGGTPAERLPAVEAIAPKVEPIGVAARTVGKASLANDNKFSYTAPSNLVLFVFINSLATGAMLVEARQNGVARRMLAGPVRVGTILLGVGSVRYLFALLQAAIILAIGRLLFSVDWGAWPAVAALVLVYAAVGAGAGLVIGAVARNPEQTSAIGIPLAIGMGMLGGCMWPLDIVPPGLRALGHLTPQAWAMDAFVKLIYEGQGLTAIMGDLAVLAGFALVLLVTGTLLLRRTLTR